MITISVHRFDDSTRVHLLRWQQQGRYPQELAGFDIADPGHMSDLAMVIEVCRCVAGVCQSLRQDPYGG